MAVVRWIYHTLTNKNPLQLKFPFAMWTAAMVQTLIAERYKVKLSHSSVCRLLYQLGLSVQRPLWRAYQQNPEAVKQWLETDYPAIRRRAKRARAQIFFADEAGVRSDFHSGTTWGRRGRTPVVSGTGARFDANLISAISAQGQLRFMLTKGRVTAAVFIQFLKGLLINASAPVFVIVDGHPTHRAKSVARYVAAQAGQLALFLLPPYSPELNPDELVWNDLKSHGTRRKLITSLAQATADGRVPNAAIAKAAGSGAPATRAPDSNFYGRVNEQRWVVDRTHGVVLRGQPARADNFDRPPGENSRSHGPGGLTSKAS